MTVTAGAVEGSTLADTGKTEALVQMPSRPSSPLPSSANPPPTPSQAQLWPSPVGAVLGEQSSWGQLLGLLFESQSVAPGQRELGAGARGRGHTRAIVQQLGRRGRLQLHLDHHLFPHLPAPPRRARACTHLPSWAAAAKLAGFLHAEGARLQMRAEARAQGSTGTEHLAGRALWGQRR